MVCLVEMSKYDPIWNREEHRIYGFVENYDNGAVFFKCKEAYIDCSRESRRRDKKRTCLFCSEN
jgi:hypothetical protein